MSQISEAYPLAALFIHACDQEVTQDKIQSVFKSLGIEYLPKIGSLFCMDTETIGSMLNVSASPAGGASAAIAPQSAQESKEDAPAKKEQLLRKKVMMSHFLVMIFKINKE
ncbi:hypothetical protein EDEG_00729 [Edhazardia aedis USNM 41457]|uniref:Uncharacterized protein n=1 Tax=Edhazardia aedis (strain USNM 41457) TaxID=1003232 RepID=J9DV79_EDHAE|nr:hypothetical protein EDEG_00729 [Edhazardia aedis USNM 41457]|eukprot:EJW05197.1 hypothetical protein EDEG_00729 [Edhazardia aedis USNM 41457]